MPKQYTLHQIRMTYNQLFPNGEIYGNLLANYSNVVQIGIQAVPGTIIQLNNNFSSITIGETGIFELDLLDRATQINSLVVTGMPTNSGDKTFLLNFLKGDN